MYLWYVILSYSILYEKYLIILMPNAFRWPFFREITWKYSNNRFFREIDSYFRNDNVIICKFVILTFSWIWRIVALSTGYQFFPWGKTLMPNFDAIPCGMASNFGINFLLLWRIFSCELSLWIEILRYFDEIFSDVIKYWLICKNRISNAIFRCYLISKLFLQIFFINYTTR